MSEPNIPDADFKEIMAVVAEALTVMDEIIDEVALAPEVITISPMLGMKVIQYMGIRMKGTRMLREILGDNET